MKQDRKQRVSKRRDDDEDMRRNIATARDFIYVQDLPITGVAVERLLKPQSWVPTSVRMLLLYVALVLTSVLAG